MYIYIYTHVYIFLYNIDTYLGLYYLCPQLNMRTCLQSVQTIFKSALDVQMHIYIYMYCRSRSSTIFQCWLAILTIFKADKEALEVRQLVFQTVQVFSFHHHCGLRLRQVGETSSFYLSGGLPKLGQVHQ